MPACEQLPADDRSLCAQRGVQSFSQPQSVQGESQGSLTSPPLCGMHMRRRTYSQGAFTRTWAAQYLCASQAQNSSPKEGSRENQLPVVFQKPALAGELGAAGGRTQQGKLFFSPAHTETCRLGAACLPLLYSFRHFSMCTQSTLSSPVCLPEDSVQLLQLWTQGKLHSQMHAESF